MHGSLTNEKVVFGHLSLCLGIAERPVQGPKLKCGFCGSSLDWRPY